MKRVDLVGKRHQNTITKQFIPTPHVVGKDGGKKILGGVRPARPDEIPRGIKNVNKY